MTRDLKITFRVTTEEVEMLEKAAAEDERKISDFVRLTLLRAIRGKGKRKART
jgi:uncharacterized protein (DUF1778 family)